MPKINDRRTALEPVAVIDAVNDEAGFEDERVRNHRIIVWIGVLLDIEVLLDYSAGSERKAHSAPIDARNS
jgi:hypothetical protein